jgi:Spy/CpxP family protein refolding chaperone
MNLRDAIKITVPALLIAVATCALTWGLRARAAAPASNPAAEDPLLNWLEISPADRATIAQHDVAFDQDLQRMRSDLQSKRGQLAAMLEKSDTTDQEIRDAVEAVITANAALQRRVMEHVLAIRDHLTPAQQQRLLSLCAQGIRQGPGWQWRGGAGGGAGMGAGAGRGMGPGPGGPGPMGGGIRQKSTHENDMGALSPSWSTSLLSHTIAS